MNLVLGTMNFGPQVNLAEAQKMVTSFLDAGYTEIDAAYVYNEGVTEKMLGQIFKSHKRESFSVATKVNPRITGKLDRRAVFMQCNESLDRMKLETADLLYLHMPDANTPVEESLEACAELYEQNKIRDIGLSNFPSWLVAHCWHICDKNGWPKPTVYQGLYNGISRKVEKELFDCLRILNMKFYAFNPLAGGLLTGKHLVYDSKPDEGRFARLASYRNRYWKKSYFEAVNELTQICNDQGIKPAEAAYVWLAKHSQLHQKNDDAIIIGASSINQFEANIQAAKREALHSDILNTFDAAWQQSAADSPDYFYYYKQ
jgi:aflatoxin B1 aldehyde reductase